MNKRLTLSFDKDIIEKAKQYALKNNICLSQLTEYTFREMIAFDKKFPIVDWVKKVSAGKPVYKNKTKQETRQLYFESK